MAALVLNKPVCTQLDRHTDMLSLGGRPPASAVFEIAWNDTGKISTLNMTVTVDGGGAVCLASGSESTTIELRSDFGIMPPITLVDTKMLNVNYAEVATNALQSGY